MMNQNISHRFWLFFFLLFLVNCGYSQSTSKKQTVLEKAHDRKIEVAELVKTDQKLFNVKIYSVDKVAINRQHHWFLKVADLEGNPINYANVELSGYLKSNPEIKFKYNNPVFKLCSEGKYIIGFVKVKDSGVWVLNASIDNYGKKDTFTYEIEIGENCNL